MKTIHGPIFSEKKYLNEPLLEIFFSFLEGNLTLNDIFTNMGFKIWKNCRGLKGELIGGNLFVLNNLIGTEYEPDWRNKILFIESVGLSKEIVISMIVHLKQIGIFDKLNGLIIGNLGYPEDSLGIILNILKDFKGFILKTEKIGHVNNNLPIIIGETIEWNGKQLIF